MSATDRLIVAGHALIVVGEGASESVERVGERGRAMSGRDAGRVRAEYGVFRFRIYDMTPTAWASFCRDTRPGRLVQCSGALIPAGLYTVTREAAHEWHGHRKTSERHMVAPTITLTQAGEDA